MSIAPSRTDCKTVELAAIAVLLASVAWLLLGPIYTTGLWIERPNEGWNAIHAMHAFDGMLYPPRGSFLINNYPPLWPYLIGTLAHFGADPIIAGRIVSLAAFAAAGVGLFALLGALETTIDAAAIGALSFMLMTCGLLSEYVGLAEPQMLAEALAIWGAVALIKSRSPRHAMAAAVVTLLALLTKQIVIGVPIACFFWVAIHRRRLLWPWAGTLLALAFLSLLLLFLDYGQNLIANLFFPRVFSFSRLMTNLALVSRVAIPLIFFAAVSWPKQERGEAASFAWLAILSGILVIVLFGGAAGVGVNIVFDLAIGCSIGMGVAWHQLSHSGYPARLTNVARGLVVVALLVRVGVGTSYAALAFPIDRHVRVGLEEASAAGAALRRELASVRDPVACEALSICLWSGHLSEVDLWKLHYETTLTAAVDAQSLLTRIAHGQFGVVVLLEHSDPVQDRNLRGLGAALAAGYGPPRLRGDHGTSLFAPKRGEP